MTVALWLVPEERARVRLASIIDELSEEFAAPRFAPHLTLLHPIDPANIESKLEVLALEVGRIAVRSIGVMVGEEFYRSVFLSVALVAPLIKARRAAERIFAAETSSFLPHLSLIYADLGMAQRRAVAGRFAGLTNQSLVLDSIEAVDVSGPVEEWRTVAVKPLAVSR